MGVEGAKATCSLLVALWLDSLAVVSRRPLLVPAFAAAGGGDLLRRPTRMTGDKKRPLPYDRNGCGKNLIKFLFLTMAQKVGPPSAGGGMPLAVAKAGATRVPREDSGNLFMEPGQSMINKEHKLSFPPINMRAQPQPKEINRIARRGSRGHRSEWLPSGAFAAGESEGRCRVSAPARRRPSNEVNLSPTAIKISCICFLNMV